MHNAACSPSSSLLFPVDPSLGLGTNETCPVALGPWPIVLLLTTVHLRSGWTSSQIDEPNFEGRKK